LGIPGKENLLVYQWDLCDGMVQKGWHEKIEICRSREVFTSVF
jgi:hypothetical protein